MFIIKFDSPFNAKEKYDIEVACHQTRDVSNMAVKGVSLAIHDDKERRRIVEWFGTSIPLNVATMCRQMDSFIQDGGRTITFVDRRHKAEKMIDYQGPGVQATYGATIPMTECDYAYVKLLSDAEKTGIGHTGSGMRMYLGERFFNPSKTIVDRTATLYHEIAHKVFGVPDIEYKPGPCRQLAKTSPARALKNPDSWCLYATSFIFNWP